jgi:flavin reductase (DIM6/NTAB) family NADH-FMN oxidoreductase RutF
MSPERSQFDQLMGQVDYSLFIVTVAAEGERGGCLIGFASHVSIRPARFLACLSVKNRTYRIARRADVLVVHFVPEQAQGLAVLFGGETGDETDKFERCEWRPGPGGAPVLVDLEDWFAGRVLDKLDFGDHCGFLLEPIEGEAHSSGSSLTFSRAKWIEPGHEP